MNVFFLLSVYASPISITHDIRTRYLHREPIVITYRMENISNETYTIPDLSYQTWRSTFTLVSRGKKEIRSNEKKSKYPTWALPPKGSRLLRLEIPSGHTLSTGEYTLTLNLDYDIAQFSETHSIAIYPSKSNSVDLIRSIDGSCRALWTEENTQGTYYNTGTHSEYISPTSHEPKLIVHPNTAPYIFSVQGQNIHIQGKQQYNVNLPYKDAQALSRMSFFKDQYHIPIWIPNSKKLMLMHVNQKGIPSFRHVRSNTPVIINTDVTHTSQGAPLYLVHHELGVELIKVDPPQNPKWPINSQYVYKKKSTEEIRYAQFELHPQEGIAVRMIIQEDTATYRIATSLSGTILSKEKISPVPKGTIVDMYQSSLLVQQEQLLFMHNNTTTLHPKNSSCRIYKKGLICFEDGTWILPQ